MTIQEAVRLCLTESRIECQRHGMETPGTAVPGEREQAPSLRFQDGT